MVVGAFPVLKLGILAFKQLSKPVANLLKERAKHSPFFRRYVCMPPAQFYNWAEVKTKMWALNLGKPTAVPQLSETMAIELGANLLGEFIIFTIGAGLLVFEYVRQVKKDSAKEELIVQEKKELIHTLNDFALQLERQDARIREMTRVVADLESRNWLPKLPQLLPNKKKDREDQPPPPPPPSGDKDSTVLKESSQPTTVMGNYTANGGVLFKALNLIESEIFYSEEPTSKEHRIIEDALVYLNYTIYE